jgi:hypothetical protein
MGVLGFTFCYVSSVPVLVDHASRFVPDILSNRKSVMSRLALFTAVLVWLFVKFALQVEFLTANGLGLLYTGLIVASLLVAEYSALCMILARRNFSKIYQGYVNLSLQRTRGDRASNFVQSYRHLREHGNAFYIVLCEILLGVGLYSICNLVPTGNVEIPAGNLLLLAVLLGLWVLPGVLVWNLATKLEIEFASRGFCGSDLKRHNSAQ